MSAQKTAYHHPALAETIMEAAKAFNGRATQVIPWPSANFVASGAILIAAPAIAGVRVISAAPYVFGNTLA